MNNIIFSIPCLIIFTLLLLGRFLAMMAIYGHADTYRPHFRKGTMHCLIIGGLATFVAYQTGGPVLTMIYAVLTAIFVILGIICYFSMG